MPDDSNPTMTVRRDKFPTALRTMANKLRDYNRTEILNLWDRRIEIANYLEAAADAFDFRHFDKWCDELDRISLNQGFRIKITEQTGRDCWHQYFDRGVSPLQAYTEDVSNE